MVAGLGNARTAVNAKTSDAPHPPAEVVRRAGAQRRMRRKIERGDAETRRERVNAAGRRCRRSVGSRGPFAALRLCGSSESSDAPHPPAEVVRRAGAQRSHRWTERPRGPVPGVAAALSRTGRRWHFGGPIPILRRNKVTQLAYRRARGDERPRRRPKAGGEVPLRIHDVKNRAPPKPADGQHEGTIWNKVRTFFGKVNSKSASRIKHSCDITIWFLGSSLFVSQISNPHSRCNSGPSQLGCLGHRRLRSRRR